jgi:NAD(P)-dependent dehydrogenase (short-subunit alcohol dehydrogenase family)
MPDSPLPLPPSPAGHRPITVAITGAQGRLGQALLRRWHGRGASLIALTSRSHPLTLKDADGQLIPLRQAHWRVGEEDDLTGLLGEVDLLVLNHGVNVHGGRSATDTALSLEVNALSGWRLLERFAGVVDARNQDSYRPRAEVWVNTSEAEIQPAFSPLYELSKRLLGHLLSLRSLDLARSLTIRRLVLGPFRSSLNPIGVMDADWVAGEVMRQAGWGCRLIIVTPNPLTYVLMPLALLGRWAYFQVASRGAPPGDEEGTVPLRNRDR